MGIYMGSSSASKQVYSEEERMRAFEDMLEKLRPLVGKNRWDYCVIWKLGGYKSRCIELAVCCCGGAKETPKESEEDLFQFKYNNPCRDTGFPHPTRTLACDGLAKLPVSIPSSSGIRGVVLLSGQSRWLNLGDGSASQSSDVMEAVVGTQVLIPVLGGQGLLEFFVAKDVPKDQQMIEVIMAKYTNSWWQDDITLKTCTVKNEDQRLREGRIHNGTPLGDGYRLIRLQEPLNERLNIEESSTWSIPLREFLPFDSYPVHMSEQVMELGNRSVQMTSSELRADSSKSKQNEYTNLLIRPETDFLSDCGNRKDEEDLVDASRTTRKSRNLIVERKRRNRIKERLLTLRSLVPKITNMDKQSILGDAISFIEELQQKVKDLQDELRELDEQEASYSTELEIQGNFCKRKTEDDETGRSSISDISTEQPKQSQDSSSADDLTQKMEVKMEVSQFHQNEFFLQLFCQKSQGWFTKLMETISAFGLHVKDASVTTSEGKASTMFRIEAHNEIHAQETSGSLVRMLQNGQLVN